MCFKELLDEETQRVAALFHEGGPASMVFSAITGGRFVGLLEVESV